MGETPRKRALQAAYCEAHELRYDPSAPGCPLCRRTAAPPPRRRGVPVVALLGGAAVVLAMVLWPRSGSQPGGDRPSPAVAEGSSDRHPSASRRGGGDIDPAPYRAEMQALEAVLFAPQPAVLGTGMLILEAAERLAERLLGSGRLELEHAGLEILELGKGVALEETVGYALVDLPRARRYWVSLRSQHFRMATWFRDGRAELDPPGRGRRGGLERLPRPPAADPLVVAELKQAADGIQELVHEARRRAFEVGEVTGEGDPERRSKEAAWTAFSRDWDRHLSERAPAVASASDQPVALLQASQALGQALHELRLLTYTAYSWTNVPTLYERERHLDSAQAAIAEARRVLESPR